MWSKGEQQEKTKTNPKKLQFPDNPAFEFTSHYYFGILLFRIAPRNSALEGRGLCRSWDARRHHRAHRNHLGD